MLNHSVAANANVWSGHLHPVESDPATQTDGISIRGLREKQNKETGGKREESKSGKLTQIPAS